MSEIKVNNIQSLSGTNGPEISGTVEMNSTGAMSLPRGDTAYRGGRGRGVFAGGATPTIQNVIDYITIATTGNASDFGDLNLGSKGSAGYSSATRGFISGGAITASPNVTASIRYVEIQSTGNSFDFGDLTSTVNNVDAGGCADSTRGLHMGGIGSSNDDTVNYITMASKGNATEFGKLIQGTQLNGGTSNSTRGISCGGNPSLNLNTIEFCTIQTTGDFQDFGDLLSSNRNNAAASDGTRGVIFGGYDDPAYTDTIQYVTIASLGDAIDFGDLTVARASCGTVSDSHGGLGGF